MKLNFVELVKKLNNSKLNKKQKNTTNQKSFVIKGRQ